MDTSKPRRNDVFFGGFEEAARNNVEAARMLVELCGDFTNAAAKVARLHDLEHHGDEIAHGVFQELNKVFMPPIDREDIIAIIGPLDDVMDEIHGAADAMCLYNIHAPTPVARSLASVILACTEEVAKQLPHLRRRRTMRNLELGVIELHRLENQADTLLRDGLRELFHEPHDPIEVIAWNTIYQTMEQVTDKCEDIADVLRGIVIKHA